MTTTSSDPVLTWGQAQQAHAASLGWGSLSWRALGTSVQLVVTEPERLADARDAVQQVLDDIDLAASRFRDDSELSRLNAADGREQVASPLFRQALRVALDAAAWTDGLVDPTVGASMLATGYDRTYRLLDRDGPADHRRAAARARLAARRARRRQRTGTRTARAWSSTSAPRPRAWPVTSAPRPRPQRPGAVCCSAWAVTSRSPGRPRPRAGRSGSPTGPTPSCRSRRRRRRRPSLVLARRARHLGHAGQALAPRRLVDAPHHRPAQRRPGVRTVGHGQRHRHDLRPGQRGLDGSGHPRRRRTRLARRPRPAVPAGRHRPPGRARRRMACAARDLARRSGHDRSPAPRRSRPRRCGSSPAAPASPRSSCSPSPRCSASPRPSARWPAGPGRGSPPSSCTATSRCSRWSSCSSTSSPRWPTRYVDVGWLSIVVPFWSHYKTLQVAARHHRVRPAAADRRDQPAAAADPRPVVAGHPPVELRRLAARAAALPQHRYGRRARRLGRLARRRRRRRRRCRRRRPARHAATSRARSPASPGAPDDRPHRPAAPAAASTGPAASRPERRHQSAGCCAPRSSGATTSPPTSSGMAAARPRGGDDHRCRRGQRPARPRRRRLPRRPQDAHRGGGLRPGRRRRQRLRGRAGQQQGLRADGPVAAPRARRAAARRPRGRRRPDPPRRCTPARPR